MNIKKRIEQMINSKNMLSGIGVASFLESTVLPLPLEAILIPLMQARREKLWLIATVTTLGCMLGAVVGYLIGYYLFDLLRAPIMTYLTTEAQFGEFQEQMQDYGFWFVFSTGVTPIPLQIAMLVAGFTSYSFFLYMLAVTSSRITRYFSLAVLVYYFGNQTEKFIQQYKWPVIIAVMVMLTIFIAYRFMTYLP